MTEEVSHSGIVKSVGPDKTIVGIVSQSACGACHAKGLCSAAEAMEKDIEVATVPGLEPGDEVEVVLQGSLGLKAALLSYAVPVLLLLVVVVALSYTSLHELWTGLIGFAVAGAWFCVLWLLRGRFEKEYSFAIRRK